jgi:hypothetical protein
MSISAMVSQMLNWSKQVLIQGIGPGGLQQNASRPPVERDGVVGHDALSLCTERAVLTTTRLGTAFDTRQLSA